MQILTLPILEVILVGALAGLVGVLAVLNQRVFFAESVTHGTFPGAVLGVVIASTLGGGHEAVSAALFAGAFIMCAPLAWVMRALAKIPGISSQAAAGIVLTLGFALGYFLATWFAPLPLQVGSFLTGSVLTVSTTDVVLAGLCLTGALIIARGRGRTLLQHCFDPTSLPPKVRARSEATILAAIMVTVVVLIPAVGTILSIALLAAPAAGLKDLMPTLRSYVIAAPIAGAGIGLVGLAAAVAGDFSAGGCIGLASGLFVVVCRAVRAVRGRQ
ncbi:metal ABC transporter permease [Schaalia vaccimaxillae]|uniref:metal ABC transporter permease n=1 Tax=Schaalia vaccimaxillae TaxID=183916 RepID=UPI0005903EF7